MPFKIGVCLVPMEGTYTWVGIESFAMVSKSEKQSESERPSKKQDETGGQEHLGQEAAHASKELGKLLDVQKHVDKTSSLSGVNVDHTDGSHIKLNNKGQVSGVTTSTGETREYRYGSDGKPNEFKDKSGTWQSADNKTWHCVSDPKQADRQMEIYVDKRGNCHEKHEHGTIVRQASGQTIERDADNRVTAMTSAGGDSQHFKYDKHGKLIEFKDSREGCTWKSENGWFWHNEKSQRWEGAFTPNPKDGSYGRFDGYSHVTTVYHADKSIDMIQPGSNAVIHTSDKGQITSVAIAGGELGKFQFEYSGGMLSKVHEPTGAIWQTKDGHNWTDQNGQPFKGSITVESNGAVRRQGDDGRVTKDNSDGSHYEKEPNGHAVLTDRYGVRQEVHTPQSGAMLVRAAEAIHQSFSDVKSDAAAALLKNASEDERAQIAKVYKNLFNSDLERDLERGIWRPDVRDQALSYLRLKDGDSPSAEAAKKEAVYLHSQFASLQESGSLYRTDFAVQQRVEEQMRSTLSRMNSQQICKLNEEYKELYGKTLNEALADNARELKRLSPDGYEALAIYSKGLDKRKDDDVTKLAEIAMRNKDLQMFQEVFAQTDDGQRKHFIDHGGEDKVRQAFGAGPLDRIGQAANHIFTEIILQGAQVPAKHSLNSSDGKLPTHLPGQDSFESLRGGKDAQDTRETIALDYLHYGKRSVPSEIRESIKTFQTDEKNVEKTLSRMTLKDRMLYEAGKLLQENPAAAVTLPDKTTANDAKYFYNQTHGALEDAARQCLEFKGLAKPDSLKVAQWEEQILYPGASFLQQLNRDRNILGGQDVNTVCREIEKMSQANWERLRPDSDFKPGQDSEYKKFVVNAIKEYFPDEEHRKKVLSVLETGGRSVNDRLDWASKPADVIAALSDMPEASLNHLKNRHIDWDNLCDKVHEHMQFATNEEKKVADWLLEQARDGKRPEPQLLESFVKASGEDLDPKKAMRLYEELRNDKKSGYFQLPAEIKAAYERTLLKKFDQAQRKELTEHGRLPIEDRVKLYLRGVMGGDDQKGLAEDLLKYPPIGGKSLAENEHLKKVFSADQLAALDNSLKQMDDKQKMERYAELFGVAYDSKSKVVDGLLAQLQDEQRKEIDGKAESLEHAADVMRAYKLGIGDREQALSLLDTLNPAQLERMESDYAIRYGRSLVGDIKDLPEPDRTEFTRALTNRSADERLHQAIDDVHASNNFFGRAASDSFSQSGPEMEEARIRLQAHMAEAARHYRELSPAEREQLVNNIAQALEHFKKDKSAAADVASSVAMAAIAIGASVPSAGFSIGALALVGGAANPLARAAVIGADYDSKQMATDIVAGLLGGATSGLSSAHVLKLMPFGKAIGKQAAVDCAHALALTGPAEAALERESIALTQNALRNGGEIPAHAIDDLADKILKMPGTPAKMTHEQIVNELKKDYMTALQAGVKQELANPVKGFLTGKVVTNAVAAGAGGGIQGSMTGAMQWNPEKNIYENSGAIIEQGAWSSARAAIGAGGGTLLFGGVGGRAGAGAGISSRAVEHSRAIRESTGSNLPGLIPSVAPISLDHEDERPHSPKAKPLQKVELPDVEIENHPKKRSDDRKV